jgi:hypothetical protein
VRATIGSRERVGSSTEAAVSFVTFEVALGFARVAVSRCVSSDLIEHSPPRKMNAS